MQHHDGRRVRWRRPDHAVFEIMSADAEEAGGRESSHAYRSCNCTTRCTPFTRSSPPPLRGRVREGGTLQSPALATPSSPPLPLKGEESRASHAAKSCISLSQHVMSSHHHPAI